MRILSLTMNAFMTYKDLTTIHFDELIDHGLYLISGPTGAGKTTIFDAMTFALYGVASGTYRNQSYFRSDFAEAKEETYVEMTFELHQKIYTVKRSPTYIRPGYKTPKMANAYLQYDDVMIEGVKEVNNKINELLGVDVHQFKQIVMIAQGEFTKLIYANSEERERVLRHIFHSDPLVSFENILKEETRKYKEKYQLSSGQLLSRFQLLDFSKEFQEIHQDGFHPSYIDDAIQENDKLYALVQEYQKQYQKHKDQYEQLSQAYYQKQKHNQDLQEYHQVQQAYQTLSNQQAKMEQIKKDIDKLNIIEKNQSLIYQYQQTQLQLQNNQKQSENITSQLQQCTTLFKDIQKKYANLSVIQQEKDALMVEMEKSKQAFLKQKEYQKLKLSSQKLHRTYQQTQQKYNELLSTHQKFIKRMERDQENVNHLPNLQLELQQKEQLVKEVNQKRVSIHELSEFYDDFTKLQDQHYELSNEYKKKDAIYQDVFLRYQKEDENFKRQQAGILASTLEDNQPCPVCGSLSHPHLATLTFKVLTSNELEELNQEVEKKKAIKEDAYQEVLSQNERIHQMKAKIDVLKKQLNIEEELSKEVFIRLLSDIIHIVEDQEKTYQKYYTEVAYLKRIQKSLEQDQIVCDKQKQELDQFQELLYSQEKQASIYQTQIQELISQYEQIDSQDYQKVLKSQQDQLELLNQHIHNIEEQYYQCQKDISVFTQQKETLAQQTIQLQTDYQQLEKQYLNFISSSFNDIQEFHDYQQMLEQKSEKENIYQNYLVEQKTLLTRLKTLETLTQGQEMVDLSQEEVRLKELEEKRDFHFQTYNQKLHTYTKNQEILKALQKDYTKNQDIFEKYTMYQDLSDITSGKNPQRMSFERYVLSAYFEHILEYANIELLKMSNGRFALYRKQAVKGAKQQGLDLSVLDYETGIMRDIQSLSGGESFKAALSLALGLSSMIQSYAGGIELNTLFIDEGFGTLDSESIDQALSVLLDLKNDNKVIGIISHVDELKERISTQIVVEKGVQGSILHIEKE